VLRSRNCRRANQRIRRVQRLAGDPPIEQRGLALPAIVATTPIGFLQQILVTTPADVRAITCIGTAASLVVVEEVIKGVPAQ